MRSTDARRRRFRRLARTLFGAGLLSLTVVVAIDAAGGAQSSPSTTSTTSTSTTSVTSPASGDDELPSTPPAVANEPGAEPIEAEPRLTG